MPRADTRTTSGKINFTTEKKILLHALDYVRYEEEFEVPFAVSQEGIAAAVGIRRDNVPRAMRRLKDDEIVYEKVVRVQGVRRRRKVYFLTSRGKEVALKLRHLAEQMSVTLVDKEGNEGTTTLSGAVTHILENTDVPVSLVSVIRAYVQDEKVDVNAYVETTSAEKEQKGAPSTGKVTITGDAPRPRYFVGRKEELDRLTVFIEEGSPRVMVIHGIAGIGKTTLAVRMMTELEGTVHIMWYRFHRWDTLRNVLNSLAAFLSRLNRKRLKNALASSPATEMHEVARILEDDLADLDAVLFFDDYQRAKERIPEFFSLLLDASERVSGPKIIVVGRRVMPFYDRGAVLVRKVVGEMGLDGLDEEASRAFLMTKGVSPDKADAIYQKTRGHPLFLELMASARDIDDKKDLKRYIYEEIFQNLAEDEKALLRIASVFRYPVPSSAFFMEEGIGYEVLDSLVERNLLQEMTYDEYDVHDIIREFFYTRLEPPKRQKYHKKAADYYMEEGTDLGALEASWHLIRAGEPDSAMGLLANTGSALIAGGYVSELNHVLKALEKAELGEKNLAEYHLLRAKTLTVSGEWVGADREFRLAIEEGQKGGSKLVLSEAHRELGHICRHRGEVEEAVGHYRKALELSEGIDDLPGVADGYRGLAEVYGGKGEFDKALEFHERSIGYARKADARDILAKTYIDVGTIRCNMGHLDLAADYHKKALDLLEDSENLQDKARVSRNLGVVLANKGDYDAALVYFDEAINLSDSVGDLQGMGISLASAGEVHIRRGNGETAREYLDEALEIFQKLGSSNKVGWVYLIKSELLRKSGDLPGARDLANKSLEIFQKAGEPYYVARSHRQLAQTFLDGGDKAKASRHAGQARSLYQRMGIPEPQIRT